MSPPPPVALRRPEASSARSLWALLVRDLARGRRGRGLPWLRMLLVGITAAVAWGALDQFNDALRYGGTARAAEAGWLIVAALACAGLLLTPALAVQALRAEREAGTLDLLLLAGIGPTTLACGRTLSTWLLLQSLVLDALPALAAFAFFRSPAPGDLALAAVVVGALNLALAGVAVGVSAWMRRAGPCFAMTLVLLVAGVLACVMVQETESSRRAPTPLSMLVVLAEGRDLHAMGAAWWLDGLAVLAAIGVAGGLAARAGLAGRREPRTSRRRASKSDHAPLSGRWPLTRLVLRGSAAARPHVQLAAFTGLMAGALVLGHLVLVARRGSVGIRDLLDPLLGAVLGSVFGSLAIVVAACAGAIQVGTRRERGTWEWHVAAARRGPDLLRDLLAAAVTPAATPLGLALLFLSVGGFLDGVPPVVLAGMAGGLVAMTLLAGLLGSCAGLATRSAAGAVAFALVLLVALPAAGVASAVLAKGAPTAWLSLLSSSALVLLVVAGLRAGWMPTLSSGVAASVALLLIAVPAALAATALDHSGPQWTFVAASAAAGAILAASAVTWITSPRRPAPSPWPVASMVLLPVAILFHVVIGPFGSSDEAILGLASSLLVPWPAVSSDADPGLEAFVRSVLPLSVLVPFLALLLHHPDRWLGRTG